MAIRGGLLFFILGAREWKLVNLGKSYGSGLMSGGFGWKKLNQSGKYFFFIDPQIERVLMKNVTKFVDQKLKKKVFWTRFEPKSMTC